MIYLAWLWWPHLHDMTLGIPIFSTVSCR